MGGVRVVRVVRRLVGELHREAERERVLRAHLPQLLESFDAGDGGQFFGGLQERQLFGGTRGMTKSEGDGVSDHVFTVEVAPFLRRALAVLAVGRP